MKGRRAADRRREREGNGGGDGEGRGDGLTTPGALPDDIDDVDAVEPLPSEEGSVPDAELPMVSEVREIEAEAPSQQAGTTPGRRGHTDEPMSNDPEASFVKAVRATAEPRGTIGDVTAVHTAPQKPRKRGARLVVLEGPDQGGEADLDVVPSLLGRTAAAEIGLTDPTISLRHVELRRNASGEGFSLVDLGSTSGTLVNGALVDGETDLRHGDVIQMGKTVLRFLRGPKEPAPRPEPAPPPIEPTEQLPDRSRVSRSGASAGGTRASGASPRSGTGATSAGTSAGTAVRAPTVVAPKPAVDPAVVRERVRKTTTRVIAACVAILVVALVGKVVHGRYIADSSPAQIRVQVAELLADGRNRLRAQDVDGAVAAAETVLALDAGNGEAESLLKMARTEMEARDAVALALRLGDEERDVEAGQILKRIADASVFAPTRDRLKRTLDERGELRSRRSIESLLDQGRLDDAIAAAEKHVATWPDDAEGQALLDRARDAKQKNPGPPALGEARAAFAAGDTARAKELARARGMSGYARDVEAFEAALEKGRGALSRFDGEAASSLDEAFRLLGALGANASSPIFKDVRGPYGKALLLAGNEKLDAPGAAAKCAGARDLFKAARVLADNPAIQQRLRDLERMALAGLERARAARAQDADRAAALAREHACFARPGTRTWEDLRALSRL